MRSPLALVIVAAFIASTGSLRGQSLLNKVEQQLPGPAGAAADSAPVPGSGYLGAVLDDDDQMNRGVRVKEVRPGAPADLGGLKGGDLITAIDAKAITRMDDLDVILNKALPGQRLRLLVDRAGKQQSLNVLLGTRSTTTAPPLEPAPGAAPPAPTPGASPPLATTTDPLLIPPSTATSPAPTAPSATTPAPGAPPLVAPETTPAPSFETPAPIRSRPTGPPASSTEPAPTDNRFAQPETSDPLPAPATGGSGASLGISVLPLTDEARATYGLTVRRGAFIAGLRPGSPAERAGLPVGGVIVALNGRRVDSADDLVSFIATAQPGQEVELAYYEGSRLTRKTVRLAPASQTAPSTATPSVVAPASPAPAPRTGPLGLGGIGGLGNSDRPLLNRVERMVDGLTVPRAPSTVYNPADMAALQTHLAELTQQLRAVEERLNALEGKGTPTSSSPISPFAPPRTGP